MIALEKRYVKNVNWILFLLTLTLALLGLENLYSASFQMGLTAFKRQLIWFGLGVACCLTVSSIKPNVFERYTNHIYVISLLLLVFVLLLGQEVSGSKSWINIFGVASIQPSEFVKIAVILALAKFYYTDNEDRAYHLTDLIKPFIIVACPLVLILLQPDLGTTFMVAIISATVILFMGIRIKSLLFLLLLAVSLSFPTWHFLLRDYQKERIMTFLEPSRDPLGAGYNAIQSKVAIGSGGVLGKGFMQGSQTQLRFIPEQHTDFAFSVIAEEWGFVGAGFTVILCFLIILWCLDAASKARDKFTGVVCLGVAAMFFWHTFVNVGMVTGLLPVTGVPLLLFSYGGSSFLTAMICIGLVLGAQLNRFSMTP